MKKINKKALLLTLLSMCMLGACSKPSESSFLENSSNIDINNSESSSINLSNVINSDISSGSLVSSVTYSSETISSSSASSSSKSSASSSTPTHYSGWDVDTTLRGAAFRDHLCALINRKGNGSTDYDNMIDVGAAAAAYGNSGKFIPFYHGPETLASKGQCNREHTWPNSRGGGSKEGGSRIEKDPFMVRPTLSSENSDRSNFFYGLAGKNNREWDPASCGYEPSRGESARIIFFIAVRYGKSNRLSLTNNPYDANSARTMGRLDKMYEWNKQYPPTANEIQINNYLETQGYGRNPFVDYPDLVDYIWSASGILESTANYYSNTGLSYQNIVQKCSYLQENFKAN